MLQSSLPHGKVEEQPPVDEDQIPALSWKIATEPKLYRELAINPYSPEAKKVISARFPNSNITDIIKAVILAEPEGKYDRYFKNLPVKLQTAKTHRQALITSEILQRLNEFAGRCSAELAKLPEDSIYEILFKTAFQSFDIAEIELNFSRDQRKSIKLLILDYVGKLKSFADQASQPPIIPDKLFFFSRFAIPKPGNILSGIACSVVLLVTLFYPSLISGGKSLFTFLDKQTVAHGQVITKATAKQKNGRAVLAVDFQKTGPGIPVRLKIPLIGVDSAIEQVGLSSGGEMAVPANSKDGGWFEPGTRPGEKGSAVIAGHFDAENGQPGVFASLYRLKAGDKIYVEDDTGASIEFIVKASHSFDPGFADEVFNPDDKAYLNLITCDGSWNEAKKSYSKRLVVFAEIAQ